MTTLGARVLKGVQQVLRFGVLLDSIGVRGNLARLSGGSCNFPNSKHSHHFPHLTLRN